MPGLNEKGRKDLRLFYLRSSPGRNYRRRRRRVDRFLTEQPFGRRLRQRRFPPGPFFFAYFTHLQAIFGLLELVRASAIRGREPSLRPPRACPFGQELECPGLGLTVATNAGLAEPTLGRAGDARATHLQAALTAAFLPRHGDYRLRLRHFPALVLPYLHLRREPVLIPQRALLANLFSQRHRMCPRILTRRHAMSLPPCYRLQ